MVLGGFKVEEWGAQIERLLADSNARAELVRRGRARAARYTWPETARRTWQVYRKVTA